MSDTKEKIARYKAGLLAGTWSPAKSEEMIQDAENQAELMAAIAEMNRDPAVKAALERMISSGVRGKNKP